MRKKKFSGSFKLKIFAAASAAAVITAFFAFSGGGVRAESARDVSDYLSECGLRAVYVSEKEVTIPTEFSAVYEKYNELQKEQGFDLSRHKGHSAVSYTFTVTGYIGESGETEQGVEAHVLVCEGRIIGGDVASTRLDGFMKGLKQR